MVFLKFNYERDCIIGNGNKVNKDIKLQHFTKVSLNIPVHVEIKQDSIQKVTISTDENILQSLDLSVDYEMLNIQKEKCIKGMDHINISISMDTLKEVNLNSGGSLKSNGTIKGNSLNAYVTSGGNLEMKMAYSQINCTLSAGAQAWFVGKADNMNADLNSGSNLKTSELKIENCKVKAESGAIANVNVSGELTAEANSGGTVRYYGNPAKQNKITNSGGSVSKAE